MKPSGIGGQAVIEGVMMRNGEKYAVSVRTADGQIVVDSQTISSSRFQKSRFIKLPIIRGVVNFFDSMVLGMKTLMYSASLFAEETQEEREEREGKARKKAAAKADRLRKHGKEAQAQAVLQSCEEKLEKEAACGGAGAEKDSTDLMMTVTVIVSLIFSIALFMMLPYFLSRFLKQIISSETVILVAEGIVKLVIFTGYLLLISRMKDIQRTFMYHGAEHKCINCLEHGRELTVKNVMKSSRFHKRCGTSFLLFVVLISILLFMVIRVENPALRLGLRILLIPVIAGISYEVLRLAGRTDNAFINLISRPGLWLQRLTTREPDESMIEVAIAAVEEVFDWKAYLDENFPGWKETE